MVLPALSRRGHADDPSPNPVIAFGDQLGSGATDMAFPGRYRRSDLRMYGVQQLTE